MNLLYFVLGFVIIAGLLKQHSTRWERAISLVGYKYKFDHKRINSEKEIDCSGYVSYIVGGKRGSWQLVEQAANVFTTTRLNPETMKDGTLVAYDSGDQGWDRGRSNGVDHVGIVLEKDGHLYMCESAWHLKGVAIRPLNEALKDWNSIASKNQFGDTYLDETEFKTKQFYVGSI
jgi:hypothetical protein